MNKIHICLVSGHLLANFIPVLMKKPNKVIIISTEKMYQDGLTTRFIELLEARHIEYEFDKNEFMPSTGLANIYRFASEKTNTLLEKNPNSQLVLNITGGTKLMSLGFYAAMSGKENIQFLYTDTQHNCLEYPDNKNTVDFEPLTNVLKIRDYLKAYGANYRRSDSDSPQWQNNAETHQELSNYLANEAQKMGRFIGKLNYAANEALSNDGNHLVQPDQKINSIGDDEIAVLNQLSEEKMLQIGTQNSITFLNAEKTRYLRGHWLEEYVYLEAKKLKADDMLCGVEISWDNNQKNTRNELDIVLVHNNRMLIIECKTKNFSNPHRNNNESIYKIDSLGDDLKGLYGELWLVSARDYSETMVERAKDRRVTLIYPSELPSIGKKIQTWMDNK